MSQESCQCVRSLDAFHDIASCFLQKPRGTGFDRSWQKAKGFRDVQEPPCSLPCCAQTDVLCLQTEGRFSCVYIAPMPGLATERYEDWSKRFGGPVLGLKVAMLTGESAADVKLLGSAHIIISSPENWDMLSRKWKQRTSVRNVSLFILDELHLVGGRNGPVIEVDQPRPHLA